MVFNSAAFLVFFLLFFQLYWWINKKASVNTRNLLIIVGSYLFYGWWDWRFLSLMFISSLTDYLVGLNIVRYLGVRRKLLLVISLVVNLGVLGFFKYFNFFIDSFSTLLGFLPFEINTVTLNVILPVGISFYTFQTLSYAIDVYRGKIKQEKNILSFFAFVSFFPQLVAGPIERASNLLPQFNSKKYFDYAKVISGLRLMLWGMFKKVVIADNLGILVDQLYGQSEGLSGLATIVGSLLFAFQIYADFSGYSDIAIGTGRTLGFDLMKNFKTPYFSSSFREFWQRWHISLSTWFRDYVYIPLGGNRSGRYRVYFNLLLTFLLSGLWHGADVTFLIWGGVHGLLLILERNIKVKWNHFLNNVLVFLLVVILWIPFRAEGMNHFIQLLQSLGRCEDFNVILSIIQAFSVIKFVIILSVLFLFLIVEKHMQDRDFSEWVSQYSHAIRLVFYYVLIGLILFLGNFSVKPDFIYFQF